MLVKLAFVMQRLKKYLKRNLSGSTKIGGAIFRFYGGTAVMRGDIELMEGIPQSPTRENPAPMVKPFQFKHIWPRWANTRVFPSGGP